ncbi:MAG TPA: copper homeostasis protein CutC [Sphingobacteriaceae bacterium]
MSRLEVIAFNIESCATIEQSGAHRIELCDNSAEGGTTPSFGLVKRAREIVSIDLFPIIRPRGGDFCYSEHEFEIMQRDIEVCENIGCDGIVTGMLKTNGTVDTDRTKKLVDLAYPLEVTFHRAFDRVRDPFEALEEVIDCGCTRILTSGLYPSASEGKEVIKQLIRQADGRIVIMPGSGIRASNILELARYTGAQEFHMSARTMKNPTTAHRQSTFPEDLHHVIADRYEIQRSLEQLSKY